MDRKWLEEFGGLLGHRKEDLINHYNFSNKDVNDDTLRELYELTKWSPTSFNCSPLRLRFLKSEEAKARIEPKIGPMQGVHPNPKANPIKYGNNIFFDFFASNLLSKFK